MEKLTLPELRLICKEKGIKGYSKCKKAEMLELISNEKDVISFEGDQINVNNTPINIVLGNGMMPTHRISPENPKKVFDIIVELLVSWKRCSGNNSGNVSSNNSVDIAGLLN